MLKKGDLMTLRAVAVRPQVITGLSGKPCVYFSCFFYLLQVEKVPMPESTTYL
jgi:hypothetical protein